MRVACYDRTSVYEEAKISNDAQYDAVKEYVLEKYEQIPQRFSDKGESGGEADRPAFRQLRAWVCASEEEGVIYVWRYDRLARQAKIALEFIELCQQHQVQVYSISEPLPDSFSHASTNKLFVQLLFTFAEQQRNVIIENVRAGLAYKKQQRQYLSSAVPYGYRLVNGKIQQEVHEVRIVRYIFQLYLTKKYGYKKLCQRLTQQKFFFRERPFQPYHIYSILKNPLYYGEIKGGSLGKYLGTFEPILSKTIFLQAQEIRQSRCTAKKDTYPYLLRQKIKCPFCGRHLSSKYQWNTKKTKTLHYYHCTDRSCQGIFLRAERVESEVLEKIQAFFQYEGVYQALITQLTQQLAEKRKDEKRKVIQQKKQEAQWIKAFEEGNCSLEELKQQLQALQKPMSTSSFLSLQQCEAKVKEWLQLKDLSSRQLLCDHVCRIEVTKEKTVCGIYFRQMTQNILEGNE